MEKEKKGYKISKGRRLHVYSFFVSDERWDEREHYVEMLPIEYGKGEDRKNVGYLVKIVDAPTDHQLCTFTFRPGVSLPNVAVSERVAKHYLNTYLNR